MKESSQEARGKSALRNARVQERAFSRSLQGLGPKYCVQRYAPVRRSAEWKLAKKTALSQAKAKAETETWNRKARRKLRRLKGASFYHSSGLYSRADYARPVLEFRYCEVGIHFDILQELFAF